MSTICVCGHEESYHPTGFDGVDMGCFAGTSNGHMCECDHFQQHVDIVQAREEHEDRLTQGDRRWIPDRMKDGGVPLKELIEAMYNDGEALATVLNGLFFLDMGSTQPDMGEDESQWIWDGVFVWDHGQMWYEGSDGPGGGHHETRKMLVRPETLIELF